MTQDFPFRLPLRRIGMAKDIQQKNKMQVKKKAASSIKPGAKATIKGAPLKKNPAKKASTGKQASPIKTATKEARPKAVKSAVKTRGSEKKTVSPGKKELPKAKTLLEELRGTLLKRREEILKEILETRVRENDSLKRDVGDIYDEASTERERELSLLLGDRDRQKLIEIDEAIQRIEIGEYGICEGCGEKIAPGRLEAQPFTKLCINCKSEEERQEARQKKFEAEGVYRNIGYGEDEEV